jgi:hypothetical protein
MAKMFFATDGSYGDAEGIAIIETDELSDHFSDYAENISDYERTEWAEWFVDNNHDSQTPDDPYEECHYCENYGIGTLAEIDTALAEE